MARVHLEGMLRRGDTTVVAVCEPSPPAYGATVELFDQHGLPAPPNEPDWQRFLATYAGQLDAVIIITPHALHFTQATAALEAGLDVLLEKPMVLTRRRGRRPDRDAGSDGPAPRRRVPGQPVAAGPGGVPSPAVRRGGPDPEHQRGRLAELGRAHRWDMARSSPTSPAAASCSTPAPTCSTRSRTSPARISPRSPRGWRTMAGPSTSGRR